MPHITFSHKYLKMPLEVDAETPINDAVLLAVFKVESYHDLSPELLEYDTAYVVNDKIEHYKLPEGKLLVLLLQSELSSMKDAKELWTTIRSQDTQKELYYRSHIGKLFDIVIKER